MAKLYDGTANLRPNVGTGAGADVTKYMQHVNTTITSKSVDFIFRQIF